MLSCSHVSVPIIMSGVVDSMRTSMYFPLLLTLWTFTFTTRKDFFSGGRELVPGIGGEAAAGLPSEEKEVSVLVAEEMKATHE